MFLRSYFIILLFLSPASLGGEVNEYFPKRNVFVADVMVTKANKKIEKISAIMAESVQQHKNWYLKYVERYPGEALPYHKNFGISESEYKYFLEHSMTSSTLSKLGEVELTIEALDSEKGLIIRTRPKEFPLNGIRIYEEEGYALTKYAKLDQVSEVNQQNKASMAGRWRGKQWKHTEWDGEKGKYVALAIGKRIDHGDGILYFNVKDLLNDPIEVYYLVLLYKL